MLISPELAEISELEENDDSESDHLPPKQKEWDKSKAKIKNVKLRKPTIDISEL